MLTVVNKTTKSTTVTAIVGGKGLGKTFILFRQFYLPKRQKKSVFPGLFSQFIISILTRKKMAIDCKINYYKKL
jgi:hypothetical protein